MDRILSYRVFLKTIETGSFAAASRTLDMTPQMAGRHVDTLEKELGTRLLNRSTRKLALTEAGRVFAAGARQILESVEATKTSVQALMEVPSGQLRVSLPSTLGRCRIVPMLGSFCAQYPEVSLDVSLSDRLVDPIGERFDICLRIGEPADSELMMKQLPSYRVGAYAAPQYLEENGTPSHPRDLAGHRCLGYDFRSYPAPNLWRFSQGKEAIEIDPQHQISVDDTHALIDLALAGGGIVMTGAINLEDYLTSGRLVRVLPAFDGPRRSMNLLYHRASADVPKQRVFIEWLVRLLA
ncbi:LysR family transcriptional regulator [Erythrobacter aureus]|uniref:LysR family transcriptional regulator n=2 Tax=Erythrobacter aureus TaxID=2182384 RepID=A0A345YBJ8_9SPHN|nr:LysR family transcriptional regulator [Erythrobacter aureus]